MRSEPNCNREGGGGAEMHSCYRVNNRRVKADLILSRGKSGCICTEETCPSGTEIAPPF
jgi:hypothetical protein